MFNYKFTQFYLKKIHLDFYTFFNFLNQLFVSFVSGLSLFWNSYLYFIIYFLLKCKNYTSLFFSNAWYIDSFLYRFASIVYFMSLNITYYVIDKGFIYNFGAEGFPSLLISISKVISIVQSGFITDYIMSSLFFIFILVIIT